MKKYLFTFLTFFSINALFLCNCYTQLNTKLSLEKAINMSYQHNPNLKALKYSTQASKENEKVAISGYLPNVNLSETPYITSG